MTASSSVVSASLSVRRTEAPKSTARLDSAPDRVRVDVPLVVESVALDDDDRPRVVSRHRTDLFEDRPVAADERVDEVGDRLAFDDDAIREDVVADVERLETNLNPRASRSRAIFASISRWSATISIASPSADGSWVSTSPSVSAESADSPLALEFESASANSCNPGCVRSPRFHWKSRRLRRVQWCRRLLPLRFDPRRNRRVTAGSRRVPPRDRWRSPSVRGVRSPSPSRGERSEVGLVAGVLGHEHDDPPLRLAASSPLRWIDRIAVGTGS